MWQTLGMTLVMTLGMTLVMTLGGLGVIFRLAGQSKVRTDKSEGSKMKSGASDFGIYLILNGIRVSCDLTFTVLNHPCLCLCLCT